MVKVESPTPQSDHSVRHVEGSGIKYVVQSSLVQGHVQSRSTQPMQDVAEEQENINFTNHSLPTVEEHVVPSFQDELKAMWKIGIVASQERHQLLFMYRLSLLSIIVLCTAYSSAGIPRLLTGDLLGDNGATVCSLAGSLFVGMFSVQLAAMIIRCRMALLVTRRALKALFVVTAVVVASVVASLIPAHHDVDGVCVYPNLTLALRSVLAFGIAAPFIELLRRLVMLRSRNRTIQLLAISSAFSLVHFFATLVLNATRGTFVRRTTAIWGMLDGVFATGVAIRIFTLQLRSQRSKRRARSGAVWPDPPPRPPFTSPASASANHVHR